MADIEMGSGVSILRPRARLLRTFGDELISSETVAVIELVKNAYDADATRVWVYFHEPLEIGKGMIEVIDNGHGMDLETIRTTWMEPATLMRKRSRFSEKLGRRVLGEKGIGRFASSRLAEKLEVITRRSGSDSETGVTFDWSQFDDEEKFLDQIKVMWEQSKPKEICTGGVTEGLWDKSEKLDDNELDHGTILRMRELKTVWGKTQFEDLQRRLSKLITPSFIESDSDIKQDFQIILKLPETFSEFSEAIKPPEIIKRPHYIISGDVGAKGDYELKLKFRDKGIEEIKKGVFSLSSGKTPKCGPFKIELRVWNRDPSSLNAISGNEFTVAEIRGYLDFASGISIYRDNFRVLPYGEPFNDWLRLDIRRVQNPTRNLSNNQILGSVSISSGENVLLRDQSNREGLMEGEAYDDLKELINSVLTVLELRRWQERPKKKKMAERGLFVDFNLASIREYVTTKHPGDTQLLDAVKDKEKDLEKRVGEAEEVISRYRRLATLGMLVDTVLHEGRLPLAKIINISHIAVQDTYGAHEDNKKIMSQLRSHLRTILKQSDVLATLFRKIEPFGGRRRGRPSRISLEQVIYDAFYVLEKEIEQVGAGVDLPTTYTEVTVDQAEIQEVIVNLLNNSLYWLKQVPKDSRFIAVEVNKKEEYELEIIFSDSGPGIEEEYEDMVFDPYFSTKPSGVGLGLTIAGEIVSDYYDGRIALIKEGPLDGATFSIVLRRRI
ncbi:ATP-binding protein [Chloroflexota bacterium]